jgi:hypothetical protein
MKYFIVDALEDDHRSGDSDNFAIGIDDGASIADFVQRLMGVKYWVGERINERMTSGMFKTLMAGDPFKIKNYWGLSSHITITPTTHEEFQRLNAKRKQRLEKAKRDEAERQARLIEAQKKNDALVESAMMKISSEEARALGHGHLWKKLHNVVDTTADW